MLEILNENKEFKIFNESEDKEFKSCDGRAIIIIGKSGAYGLDLPEASAIIITDVMWNPADMEQIENRIRRITSKDNIKIITLVSEGIEAYIYNYMKKCKEMGKQATETDLEEQLKKFIRG